MSEPIENFQKYGNDQRLISAMGEQLWKNFLDSIISVIEVVCARPEMLSSYSDVIILHTLPLLANLLVTDKNSGSKLLYIKLINDLLEILIEKREHGNDKLWMIVYSLWSHETVRPVRGSVKRNRFFR